MLAPLAVYFRNQCVVPHQEHRRLTIDRSHACRSEPATILPFGAIRKSAGSQRPPPFGIPLSSGLLFCRLTRIAVGQAEGFKIAHKELSTP